MIAIIPVNGLLPKDESSSSDDDDNTLPYKSMSREAMIKLNEMRENNQLCDASIQMDDGHVFDVHRAIISSVCDYFRTLFTTNLHDHRNNTFLVGVRTAAMELVIKYAYLRDVSGINKENVMEILFLSDYLGALGLMKSCIDFVIRDLTPENCIITWLMSRYRSIIRLRDKSRIFLLENFAQVAVNNKDILELNVDDFYEIISDELLNVKDENVVWECVLRWIGHKPDSRKVHLTKLMRAIRLGLMSHSYFRTKVQKNSWVEQDPEARPIVIDTLRFINDLETMSNTSHELRTPLIGIPRLPHEVILAIGGWSEGAPQTLIESYDTRADRWVRLDCTDPNGPRSYHGTAVIRSKAYCIGGFNGIDYFNSCTRFDAAKKTWKEIAPMHNRRCYVSVATADGFIYALGGYDGSHRLKTGERYCPKKNQWTMIAPMHLQRSDANACALDGKIYIVGGFNGHECLNSAEFFDPKSNTWTMLPNMLVRRSGVSCVAHRGFIYVIGGFNGLSRMNSGEKFDPSKNAWTNIKEMYHQRSNFGLEIIDDMILAIGGFNGTVTIPHCECYLPESNEWLEASDMSIMRSALTVNVLKGLPNIRDFIHQDRDKLAEERRMKMMGIESSELMGVRNGIADLFTIARHNLPTDSEEEEFE